MVIDLFYPALYRLHFLYVNEPQNDEHGRP
ncbi:hypothetical protein J2T16_002931 [Paenibacillus intestini]|nr:hypothetical protein [Paenibacillus intestini]